jgi:hypothetical protein
MGGKWIYNTFECFRCSKKLEEDEKDYTIPIMDIDKNHYLSQVMNVMVCKECHRNNKLNELGI